jgi:hypothetical protein
MKKYLKEDLIKRKNNNMKKTAKKIPKLSWKECRDQYWEDVFDILIEKYNMYSDDAEKEIEHVLEYYKKNKIGDIVYHDGAEREAELINENYRIK